MKKPWIFGTLVAAIFAFQAGSAEAFVKVIPHESGDKSEIIIYTKQIVYMEKDFVQDRINAYFTNSVQAMFADYQELLEPGAKASTFLSDYQVTYNDGNLISMAQRIYMYTGGAHGNTFYITGTFNTETGEEITLGDLFLPGKEYKEYLTALIRDEIALRGKEEAYIFFTAVTDDTNFYLTEEGLVILYPPYGAAPYAEGTVRFLIPWWRLYDWLNVGINI